MAWVEGGGVNLSRIWAMPASETFDCLPIGELVKRYLVNSSISIDPFARNKRWATYTNDLNPETLAEYHMDALDFLVMLRGKGIKADLIIFDPPYSLRQAQECYEKFGKWIFEKTQNSIRWTDEKAVCNDLLIPGGYFLYFGWNTNGMGKKYNCEIKELLVVAHGGGHNDTLCTVEIKQQGAML